MERIRSGACCDTHRVNLINWSQVNSSCDTSALKKSLHTKPPDCCYLRTPESLMQLSVVTLHYGWCRHQILTMKNYVWKTKDDTVAIVCEAFRMTWVSANEDEFWTQLLQLRFSGCLVLTALWAQSAQSLLESCLCTTATAKTFCMKHNCNQIQVQVWTLTPQGGLCLSGVSSRSILMFIGSLLLIFSWWTTPWHYPEDIYVYPG